jgi:IS1 family transposase
MNKLPVAKRAQILTLLCEGSSMRSIERIVGCSINTVDKLLRDAGEVALAYHDEHVRGVKAIRVQCDEIWSFVAVKQKNRATSERAADPTAGDCWTWTAIDADHKLLISYLVGGRDAEYALMLMDDLRSRLANRVHHGRTPGLPASRGGSFRRRYRLQHADQALRRGSIIAGSGAAISPSECVGTRTENITGNPDPKHVSTPYAERANLTMRMAMRRFARLTNAFSKKLENHAHMVALYALWYNFVRIHKTLRTSPAMAAGIESRLWSMEDVFALIDARSAWITGDTLIG